MKRLALSLLLLVLLLSACSAKPAAAPIDTKPPEAALPSTTPAAQPDPIPRVEPPPPPPEVEMLFVGDMMLERTPGQHIEKGEDPFGAFADLMLGADLTVGNLECVISTVGETVQKLFAFRCHPRTIPILARYFDAVSVANNHSGDQGPEAFAQQLGLLKEAGLPYFGGGMNLTEAHTPLILERNGVKVALLAYNEIELRSYEAGPETPGHAWSVDEMVVADIQAAREQADVVVVYPHWGFDYDPTPSERQRSLARLMIDAGADLVVGSHSHVIQEAEFYKDRLIVYCLGNYVFDDFLDVPPALNEPSRTSWVLRVRWNKETGLVSWETTVARTDDRGFPEPLTGAESPCSKETPTEIGSCTTK